MGGGSHKKNRMPKKHRQIKTKKNMGGFAVYIEDRESVRRHVMTGETPQKVTSKKVDIKDSLTPEDVEAIIVYVHSLKNNIKPAEAIRQRALRAIDKIRPVHIHNNHRKQLRVHGYKESPREVKIRFFCPTCGRTESISVPTVSYTHLTLPTTERV